MVKFKIAYRSVFQSALGDFAYDCTYTVWEYDQAQYLFIKFVQNKERAGYTLIEWQITEIQRFEIPEA